MTDHIGPCRLLAVRTLALTLSDMGTDWGISAEGGQVYLVDLKELFIY